MVLDAVSNFVRGTADAAIASGDTTISVADASIFPDPATDGEFNVVIWNASNFPRPDQDANVEIVRVTSRDTGTNELTVTRAQEMTSAAAHPNGSAIHLSPTAKMFSDIEDTFADFWNADTQELTADVNNTNTTTEALEADSLINPRTDEELIGEASNWGQWTISITSEIDDVSSTSFTTIATTSGSIDVTRIPDGAALYGRFRGRISDADDDFRVKLGFIAPGEASGRIDELELSGGAESDVLDSDWQPVNLPNNLVSIRRVDAEVDSGTASFSDAGNWSIQFEARVD